MEIEHIISGCFIKNRAPPTKLERQACLAHALSGTRGTEGYSVGVYINNLQLQALKKIGYHELFHEHENYITKPEAEVIIEKFKQLIPTIKNKSLQKKIIGITNTIMTPFGPSFVMRMGGWI
jgi:hypothetical protein